MKKYYHEQYSTINVTPSRAYYIPFDINDKVHQSREQSSRFFSLNGVWKIQEYSSVEDALNFNCKEEPKEEIIVPSCVQYFHFDSFQYTNVRYPFPYNPPHILKKNPTYRYSRHFSHPGGEKQYLIFEGVDSCFYLFINGQFVGFSQISHRISEFDITNFLVHGDNYLDVIVLKWCAGSYLEDQDKWRFTGIFRDVYLLSRPKEHLVDFQIQTGIQNKDGWIKINNLSSIDAIIDFLDEQRVILAGKSETFLIKNAQFWSAETPYLYPLSLSANGEVIYQEVGICTSEIKNGLYYFNGKKIKFYGVNRHDFSPEKGCAINREDIEKDLINMKKYHINAIRTSHYPSSPIFYELCNKYGFYVMSEADIECHGVVTSRGEYNDKIFSLIAEDKNFALPIIERNRCNVIEHRNFTSIVMWSLGNESGYGENFEKAISEIRTLSSLPIHYEGLCHYDRKKHSSSYYYDADLDVVSIMYPSLKMMKKFLNDKKEHRPLVLCEYLHAMGNGPGGMKEYWELMDSSPRFMGGFIWEWKDHGVIFNSQGYRYGGDFKEDLHDGNFCIDGMVGPHLEEKAGSLQIAYFYSPIRFEKQKNKLFIVNRNYFKTLNLIIYINQKKLTISLKPQQKYELSQYRNEEIHVYSEETEFAHYKKNPSYFPLISKRQSFLVEKKQNIIIKTPNMQIVFNRENGGINSIKIGETILRNLTVNFIRARIDNDRNIYQWNPLYQTSFVCNEEIIDQEKICFKLAFVTDSLTPLIFVDLIYEIIEDGIKINIKYEADKTLFKFLPRAGITLEIPKKFQNLLYQGYGPNETYCDSFEYALKKKYVSNVNQEYHHYVKPQESGSHYLVDFVEISDGMNRIYSEGMQSFSYLPYSVKTIKNALHDDELKEDEFNTLSLDLFMSGLGSNACGPLPQANKLTPLKGKGTITLHLFTNEIGHSL